MIFIGQADIVAHLNHLKHNDKLPRFMIITGGRGMGKKLLASYIAKEVLNSFKVVPGNSVESVREAIAQSYRASSPTTFIFPDADKMSIQAKNALLKVTEEPPRQSYFIMTVADIGNTLGTLKSRGTELSLNPYKEDELREIFSGTNWKESHLNTAFHLSNSPGVIKELLDLGVEELYDFCVKVVDKIGLVTGVNAFKMAANIKFKEEDKGYEPELFFSCLRYVCMERFATTPKPECNKYFDVIKATYQYGAEMASPSLKKDATFDMFILEIRDILMED